MNWERNKDEAFKPTVSNNESNKWKWSLVLMLWCLQSNSAFFSSFFQPTSYWCGPETTGKINLSSCIAEKSPGKVDGRFLSQTVLFYFHISVFFFKKKKVKNKQKMKHVSFLSYIHDVLIFIRVHRAPATLLDTTLWATCRQNSGW